MNQKDDVACELVKYVNAEMYELVLGAAQRFHHQMLPQGLAAATVYSIGTYAGFADLPREEAFKIFCRAFDDAVKFKEGKG
jgi:hypothetical protein